MVEWYSSFEAKILILEAKIRRNLLRMIRLNKSSKWRDSVLPRTSIFCLIVLYWHLSPMGNSFCHEAIDEEYKFFILFSKILYFLMEIPKESSGVLTLEKKSERKSSEMADLKNLKEHDSRWTEIEIIWLFISGILSEAFCMLIHLQLRITTTKVNKISN